MAESTSRVGRRTLGRTGLEVSRLGLAALSVQGTLRRQPSLSAEEVERAFHEHGINTFLVHSSMRALCEGVRRLIRAGHRDQLVLVSEVGLPFAGSVRRGLEKHLKLLGTDRLDVWLVGWVQRRWYLRDSVWSEVQRERQRGLVRALGISSHDRPLAAALARERDLDVLMVRYNAAHRGAEREIFEPLAALGERRPGIISYTATRWGMLLNPVPSRGFARGMTGPECYRFALGHPMVDLAWCAPSTWVELREDVDGVLQGPLEPSRLDEVRRFGEAVHETAVSGRRWMFGASAR